MKACVEFRARLARLLTGQAAAPDWAELAWHEHLHGCGECRALLEAEEALEQLLETLPEPRLPRDLCERVLDRLATERVGSDLDRLLELSEVKPPLDLADNVLRGLRTPRRVEREERALDRLLDRVPEPAAPQGLADRLLDGLEQHRERRTSLRPVEAAAFAGHEPAPSAEGTPILRWAAAAAIVATLGLGLWRLVRPTVADDARSMEVARLDPQVEQVAIEPGTDEASNLERLVEEPPAELLASLDLLESWDVLMDEDVDLDMASLDTLDELVLYMQDEELGG